jgi:hypothetical protein
MLGACFLAVIGIGSGWVVYSLSHLSINVDLPQTEAMVTALKGALRETIFNPAGKPLAEGKLVEGTGLSALLAASASGQPPNDKGLIADYQATQRNSGITRSYLILHLTLR